MSIGWFEDLEEARDYFEDERLETEAWDALFLSAGTLETKVLKMAYNRLRLDSRWDLPTYANASASELEVFSIANAEMAYYLAEHLEDEDRRKGLQAQGVITAGVVKEQYSETHLMALPVPPFVIAILKPWSTERFAGVIEISRDDDEGITF